MLGEVNGASRLAFFAVHFAVKLLVHTAPEFGAPVIVRAAAASGDPHLEGLRALFRRGMRIRICGVVSAFAESGAELERKVLTAARWLGAYRGGMSADGIAARGLVALPAKRGRQFACSENGHSSSTGAGRACVAQGS